MIALTSPASAATHSASAAMPPLPGAHQIFSTRGLCLSFHTSACSRPPPPSTRIFIRHPSRTTVRNDRRPLLGCQPARVTPRLLKVVRATLGNAHRVYPLATSCSDDQLRRRRKAF